MPLAKVNQSGDRDRRGSLSKHGPRYLRWALLEATMHALRHPAYSERYQHTKCRLGRQRGAKVAQIDIAPHDRPAVAASAAPAAAPAPARRCSMVVKLVRSTVAEVRYLSNSG